MRRTGRREVKVNYRNVSRQDDGWAVPSPVWLLDVPG